MKKAKLFLTGAAIVTIVGSALALKTNYSSDICYAPVPVSGVCTNVLGQHEITGADLNGTTPFCYAIKAAAACTATLVPNKGNVEREPQ